ncbi:MAG: hypothetical protein IKD07_04995 [Clostridia bacterium]|nr:hypothetical protein [Clostridia bacterium]
MRNHYQLLTEFFSKQIPSYIGVHKMFMSPEQEELYQKAVTGVRDGMYPGQYSIHFVIAYYLKESPYYHDEAMLEYAYESLCLYEQFIREDGSLDLATTNFHDPAQTGFHAQAIFPQAALIERLGEHTPAEDRLYEKYLEIMERMGNAMATLGFHTPNHRWIISSGLALAYHFTKNPKFKETIDRFLMEGIDCDEYGEYTERSTGSYNCCCDYSFCIMAEFLKDDSFYDPVRRNLNLMYKFIEPDKTVNTLNSTRWDMGGEYPIAKYYPYYLILAIWDKNPEFAYMAETYREEYIAKSCQHYFYLLTFHMLHPELQEGYEALTVKEPEKDQSVFLPNSRIARIYKPELNATITALCARHPVFCQINYGSAILQLRYTASFFGDPHSTFRARKIEPTSDGFRLFSEEQAGYRSTMESKPETSNWRRMDHSKRDTINVQTLRRTVDIHILEDGIRVDLCADGCDRVPTKLEITLPPQGKLLTDSIYMVPKAGDYAYLAQGNAKYFIGGNTRYFEIEGGFCEHTFGENMRGSFPADPKKFTLTLTSFSPQTSSVTIRLKQITK